MRNPTIHNADSIKKYNSEVLTKTGYVLARPLPFYGCRFFRNLKIAYYVFIGKYDALKWNDQ